ncbi:MAG: TolC family protein, partial [Endomicrobiaceae bacterium]|nr:TolC family protein [Endomicrobiaceae bacterium]
YRQFQLLQGKMQTIISYEKMLDSLYSQVSQAFGLGISSKSDYLRVKLKKEEVSVQKSQLSKMIEIAKKDLKLFAVLAEEYDVQIDKEFLAIEEPSFNTDNFSAQLKERPEYKLLQINVEVAKLQKSMKVGSYLPTVAVGASLFRTDYFSDNHFDRSAMNYQDTIAFGMISIPLSDWWEAAHSIKEMKIQYDSAQEQLESIGKYLLLDMESKLTQLETAYEQVKVAKIGLELAQTNKLESEDGYKNGTEKLSDYLEALALEQEKENKLDEAKANYFQAKTAFLISTANLEY